MGLPASSTVLRRTSALGVLAVASAAARALPVAARIDDERYGRAFPVLANLGWGKSLILAIRPVVDALARRLRCKTTTATPFALDVFTVFTVWSQHVIVLVQKGLHRWGLGVKE